MNKDHNKNYPSVSIIVPIYQVEKYVAKCIYSICRQTYKGSIECLLVDDCSPDKSVEIVNQILENYNGNILFRWLNHKTNKGISAARNTGIKEANNKYLFFIDSDDYISPTCIEKQCELVVRYENESHPVELVQFDYCVVENEEIKPSYSPTILIKEFITDHKEAKNAVLNNKHIHPEVWNKLILKEFLINNNLYFKEGIIWEDAYWTFFLAKYIQRICVSTEITYYYVRHSNSITNSKPSDLAKKSSRIYISDLINNIDPICKKSQKHRIFISLIRVC